MKQNKLLTNFMEGVEMTILPEEDQILLTSIGGECECCGTYNECTFNNCNGGNCIKGCGNK